MVVFLKLILGRLLDPEREVTIRQIKANLQPQALEAGQVDALFCLEPTCTQLERRGLGRAVSVNPLYEFIQRPFPTAASVVATRLCRENPQLVSQILSALRAVHAEIRSSPEKAAAVLPQYTPIEPDLAPFIALYDYWGVESIDRDAVQRLANLYADKGIIPKSVVTADLYASGK
jgi:ABC-type nitrate/sulfonate/bicarbonate transport system substrate-binding protein